MTTWYYWIQAVGSSGSSGKIAADFLTGIGRNPFTFTLYEAQPNPFNPATMLSFSLPESGHIELMVYDITGRKVRTLVSGPMSAGKHKTLWNGRDDSKQSISSGVYLVLLKNGETVGNSENDAYQIENHLARTTGVCIF
ncbi:MAG: FlgD immunoglobulin-like domain containing protein [Candidatus Latescibacterota bacterium]